MSVILKGTLKLWANYVKGYSRRFFVLTTDTLEYYHSSKEQHKGKKFHLTCVSIVDLSKEGQARLDTGTRVLDLKFRDEKEKKIWIENIEKAK